MGIYSLYPDGLFCTLVFSVKEKVCYCHCCSLLKRLLPFILNKSRWGDNEILSHFNCIIMWLIYLKKKLFCVCIYNSLHVCRCHMLLTTCIGMKICDQIYTHFIPFSFLLFPLFRCEIPQKPQLCKMYSNGKKCQIDDRSQDTFSDAATTSFIHSFYIKEKITPF